MPPDGLPINQPRLSELIRSHELHLNAATFSVVFTGGTAYGLEGRAKTGDADFLSSQSYRVFSTLTQMILRTLSRNITKRPSPKLMFSGLDPKTSKIHLSKNNHSTEIDSFNRIETYYTRVSWNTRYLNSVEKNLTHTNNLFC